MVCEVDEVCTLQLKGSPTGGTHVMVIPGRTGVLSSIGMCTLAYRVRVRFPYVRPYIVDSCYAGSTS
jgi:hypothetical protein